MKTLRPERWGWKLKAEVTRRAVGARAGKPPFLTCKLAGLEPSFWVSCQGLPPQHSKNLGGSIRSLPLAVLY